MNWTNIFTWLRSLFGSATTVAAGIAAAPAGTFDPHTTAIAQSVVMVGAAATAVSHLGVEASNPKTFPQTALTAVNTVAPVIQAVAPGTPAAADAAAIQAAAPVAVAAIQAIQAVHASTVAPNKGA